MYSTNTVTFLVVICIWRTVIRLQQSISIIRQLHAASGPRFTRQSQRNSFNVTWQFDVGNKAPPATERVFANKKYRFFTSFVRVETCSAPARAHSPAFIEEKSTSQKIRGRISGATYANVPERTASVLDSGQLIRRSAWQRYRFRPKIRRVWGFVGPTYRVPVECLVYY